MSKAPEKQPEPKREPRKTPPPGGEYSVCLLSGGEWSRPTLAVCPAGVQRREFVAGEAKRLRRPVGTVRVRAGCPY